MNHVLEPAESVLITAEFPYSNPNKAALEYLKTSDPDAYAAYMGYAATNPPADFLSRADSGQGCGRGDDFVRPALDRLQGRVELSRRIPLGGVRGNLNSKIWPRPGMPPSAPGRGKSRHDVWAATF